MRPEPVLPPSPRGLRKGTGSADQKADDCETGSNLGSWLDAKNPKRGGLSFKKGPGPSALAHDVRAAAPPHDEGEGPVGGGVDGRNRGPSGREKCGNLDPDVSEAPGQRKSTNRFPKSSLLLECKGVWYRCYARHDALPMVPAVRLKPGHGAIREANAVQRERGEGPETPFWEKLRENPALPQKNVTIKKKSDALRCGCILFFRTASQNGIPPSRKKKIPPPYYFWQLPIQTCQHIRIHECIHEGRWGR